MGKDIKGRLMEASEQEILDFLERTMPKRNEGMVVVGPRCLRDTLLSDSLTMFEYKGWYYYKAGYEP